MCGRFTVSYTYEQLLWYLNEDYDLFDVELDYDLPKYNIAPTEEVLGVIHDGEKYRVGTFSWGLVPSFSKDLKSTYKMINARSESIFDKISFKDNIINNRCIILADGFYEWDGHKQPYYIKLKDQKIFAFAGIYNIKKNADGTRLITASIITTEANEIMSKIHTRMPVILKRNQIKDYLNINQKSKNNINDLLTKYDTNNMEMYPVSKYVSNVRNKGVECIQKIELNTLL